MLFTAFQSKLLTDNGPQFASRQFKSFASEWSFEHVTSSPYFPQSNGFAENAVKQAKNQLEKCKKDGSDPLLGLLNLRNVPRDQVLGSPAQRLMSRRTRCVLHVAKKLLVPRALNTRHVSSRLKLKRQQQKSYHDQHAKPLLPLRSQQVVRLQTDKGYQKVGVVKQPAPQPRSYIVEAEGKKYRRNRRHLLSVPEPAPAKLTCPAATDYDVPYVPPSRVVTPSSQSPPEKPPVNTQAGSSGPLENPQRSPVKTPARPSGSEGYVTRYGRTVRPNPKFRDFVA